MSNKHKKVCTTLNYIEHFLILASAVTECVSSCFWFFTCIVIGITIPVIGLKFCAITAAIKKHKSIIKKNIKKHGKTVLLTKTKLNSIEVLISMALIESYVNDDESFLIINVLKAYDDMKEEIKNLKTSTVRQRF